MRIQFTRCPENPIVVPGLYEWRMATVFNPGALHDEGRFYLYERAAGGLRPFHCYIGMLESDDGVHFTHVSDRPVFTPEMAGSKYGSVQDPRVVKIEDTYYMTYAYRPYAWNSHPTGLGVPESHEVHFPGFSGRSEENQTRSGIAVSTNRVRWEHLCWATPADVDDRDVILFPEKIDGKFWLLRRPLQFVSPDHSSIESIDAPGIWICSSDDLQAWSDPLMIARPKQVWEGGRIGGSTPPIKTEHGWLVITHGVGPMRTYSLGAILLDLDDPTRVIARLKEPLLTANEKERDGYVPNVVYSCGSLIHNNELIVPYAMSDYSSSIVGFPLDELFDELLSKGRTQNSG